MKRPLSFAIAASFLILGCRQESSSHTVPISNKKEIQLVVLSDLAAHADNDGKLVRFVDLDSEDIQRLRTICQNRFQIVSTNSSDDSGGFLHLKGSSKAGVFLEVEVKSIDDRNAEARGCYLHVGSYVSFLYHLRNDGRAWRIISSEFESAT